MYGPEYLDWVAREEAARRLDAFLASFEPEDRKWVLSVMRDRFEVRVEYRDSLGPALLQGQLNQQANLAQQCAQPHWSNSPTRSLLGGLLG